MNPLGVQDSEKGEEGANLPSPGFADNAAKRATQGYRNGNAVATFPAFSQSRPTRESQWAFSVAARQESTNVSDALPKPGRNSGERPNTCANGTPGRLAGVSRIENRAWQYRVRGLRVSPMGCPNGFFVGDSL